MESGGQPGNQNAAKTKLWESALKRALARSSKTVDGGLNKLADNVINSAMNGEQWAIKEIAERIDGKAAQAINVGGQEDNPVIIKKVRFVKPSITE